MLRVLNIIALLAFFSSFEIASAQNWWKESSLNWLNSPQSKYNRRWKESPLYWRNVQESWYGIRVYGENDDNIIQINLLFDPLQEGYILENQEEVVINDNQEKKKTASKPHIETINASKEEAQLSDQQRHTSDEEENYIIVYGTESVRKYHLNQMKDQGIEINGMLVYGMDKHLR
jgi:hypothetical protein